MITSRLKRHGLAAYLIIGISGPFCWGQGSDTGEGQSSGEQILDRSILPAQQWQEIDNSVERGLDWLGSRQLDDGSYPTFAGGQPAVSALATLAFVSAGHLPGDGPRGEKIDQGIEYVLSCQRSDGMFLVDSTNMPVTQWERGAHTGLYNHAISSLMLCEVYGSTDAALEPRMRRAIESALAFARKMQQRKQRFADDQGGFRYYKPLNGYAGKGDADLSVTGWFVMFFRSAKNSGFDVPEDYIDEAIAYATRCYDSRQGAFYYGLHGHDKMTVGRAMTGAGLVCLAAKGNPDPDIATAAGDWLLAHPFDEYGETYGWYDRFHYGAYYCSQAMLQLGGEHWNNFYPPLAETLIAKQNEKGYWPPEMTHNDHKFGSEYSTALSILTLSSPFHLLPISQR